MKDVATRLRQAPLTAAERIEALMDAVTLLAARQRITEDLAASLLAQDASDEVFAAKLAKPLDAESEAQEIVVAHIFALMAHGHLHRCAEMMRAGTAGRV